MPDNWSNRIKERTCKTCVSYIEKTPVDTERNYVMVGRCRRHAPVVGEGYPVVFPTDWCGDHKLDENKL
jgi:hypothetical protein